MQTVHEKSSWSRIQRNSPTPLDAFFNIFFFWQYLGLISGPHTSREGVYHLSHFSIFKQTQMGHMKSRLCYHNKWLQKSIFQNIHPNHSHWATPPMLFFLFSSQLSNSHDPKPNFTTCFINAFLTNTIDWQLSFYLQSISLTPILCERQMVNIYKKPEQDKRCWDYTLFLRF
jgi:hypothetical protein